MAASSNAVCVLEALDANARELNQHLKWLSDRLTAIEAALGIQSPPNPTAKPTIVTTRTAGWGNGNKT